MYKVSLETLLKSRDLLDDLLNICVSGDLLESGDVQYEEVLEHIRFLNEEYICPE